MSRPDILSLFNDWNEALQTREAEKVAALYADDATLLPTLSSHVRHTREEIADYFASFLAKGPMGSIDEANIRELGDTAINSGLYTFAFADGSAVQARFTFVYRKIESQWIIIEHHSSQMPD